MAAAAGEGTVLDWNAALTKRQRTRGEESAGTPAAAPPVDVPRIERAFREILLAIGEDPDRDGLRDTPRRVAKAYGEMFAGLSEDPSRHLATAFEQKAQQAVVVSGIEFHSTCEHHFLPFFGKAHVAYLPSSDKVVGLSKLARTVDVFARRPQLQERLTEQICDALEEHLAPRGICVVLEAEHLCMRLRGARKPGAVTRTLGLRGHYRRDVDARREVMSLMDIRQG
ncbi:MAG: GTP cyclohydrolase I FolE [Alphaproteobacteria bacterium]